MDAHELRETFLRFFEERGHRRVPSAPIVPAGDPTLLFTSAGMVQFKPYFMGQAKAPHNRLVSVQKCFRTSDIESVGDTAHLTFFEMLGNFAIADYFKDQIIPWAWEFVTEVLGLQKDRLWAAVYLDDDDAYNEWLKVGVSAERIKRYGEEENYWFSGEVGPCGPCSEIYYDFGEQFGCAECEPNHECGRFLEIWNLVFMSFYCDGDSKTPLPTNNVDTGSGLERVSSALLYESPGWDKGRLPSCYDTDLYLPLIKKIEGLSGKTYGTDAATDRAIRILAEHARAVTFLIGDERTPVPPSNEERGYVVRRMLRRALYFARRRLGITEAIMPALADTVVDYMSASYPELERQRTFVKEILGPEERRFDETLSRGLDMLEELISRSSRSTKSISGTNAFELHDTYGFPIELTREIAAENGLAVDEAGFEAEMERQRDRGRASAGAADHVASETLYASLAPEATAFLGYEALDSTGRVLAVVSPEPELSTVDAVETGAAVELILDATPFYPEGGGQVGDRGEIRGPNGVMRVEDTQRVAERLIVHRGRITEGRIAKGDAVTASVDPQHRADTMRNHTATHLLHAALRKVLGTHARQAGSLVGPDYLRFDFTHTEAVTPEQLAEVSRLVNEKVRQDIPVSTRTTTFDKAMDEGVLAFFGDKYGAEVRVVEVNSVVPRFSAELCGGTHCHATGQVGAVIITGESSIGSGMRRIEALTGRAAEEHVREQAAALAEIARKVGAPKGAIMARIDALVSEQEALRKRVEKLERSLADGVREDLSSYVQDVDGLPVLAKRVDVPSVDALRFMADSVRKSLPLALTVLGSIIDDRAMIVVVASEMAGSRGINAAGFCRNLAEIVGGSGGGRGDTAQGGGPNVEKLDELLVTVPERARDFMKGLEATRQ